jgi:hypothetical protein
VSETESRRDLEILTSLQLGWKEACSMAIGHQGDEIEKLQGNDSFDRTF